MRDPALVGSAICHHSDAYHLVLSSLKIENRALGSSSLKLRPPSTCRMWGFSVFRDLYFSLVLAFRAGRKKKDTKRC
ncbi:hypothetical protein QL093DRAFT_2509913, partial [Fusarium oxysporum]